MTHPNRIDGVEIPKGYATIPGFKLERGLVRGYVLQQKKIDELVNNLQSLVDIQNGPP